MTPPRVTLVSQEESALGELLAALGNSPSILPRSFRRILWKYVIPVDTRTRQTAKTLVKLSREETLVTFRMSKHSITVHASPGKDLAGNSVILLRLVGIDRLRLGDVVAIPVRDEGRFGRAWDILFGEARP